jgi:hypothetical protein
MTTLDMRRRRMFLRTTLLATAVTLATLLTASDARAWGAYHVGYTHFGPNGFAHYGRTAAVGPYGAYSGGHAGFYGAGGGAYHVGYGYGERYGGYGGYHYGGFGYGGYGGYRGGFYRRW